MRKVNVAIDGPVGSGKTTIGKILATKLGYQFLDSGLLFRHFAKFWKENKLPETKDFKVENNTIYFPFSAITGIGEKVAEKIITYRQEKGQITNNWKEELVKVLNINHIQQLENLERYNLILN